MVQNSDKLGKNITKGYSLEHHAAKRAEAKKRKQANRANKGPYNKTLTQRQAQVTDPARGSASEQTIEVIANTVDPLSQVESTHTISSIAPKVEQVTNTELTGYAKHAAGKQRFRTDKALLRKIAKNDSVITSLNVGSTARKVAETIIENYTRLPWQGHDKSLRAAYEETMNAESPNHVDAEHRSRSRVGAATKGKYSAKQAIEAAWEQYQPTKTSTNA